MKTILVPTDFSSSAANALYFAIAFANKTNAGIMLVHSYELPVAMAEIPYNIWHEEQMNKRKEVEQQLRTECERLVGQVRLDYKALEGSVVDSILEFSENNAFEYIIMGTNGAGKHTAGLFGSTTSSIIERTNTPLIAVPESSYFRNEIRKITYATDYHLSDIAAINKVLKLAAAFNANLTLLHISLTELSLDEKTELMQSFMQRVRMRTGYSNLSFEVLVSDDIGDKLAAYINAGQTDMIVMATHHRNFLARLFAKSYTKALSLETTVPLLVFHHKNHR